VLRRICGPKRDEGTGGRRKLHNEENRNAHRAVVGKPEGKRTTRKTKTYAGG
jgi:hypothetical protein